MGLLDLAKRLSPKGIRGRYRRFRRQVGERLSHAMLRLAARSRFGAGFYYGFMNAELSREARAVAAGQLRYLHNSTSGGLNYYLLRRNVHRIEKGLIMRPRRPSFGLDYIESTTRVFARIATAERDCRSAELRWANDVLDTYFAEVQTNDPRFHRAREIYESAPRENGAPPAEPVARVPYARDLASPPSVDYEAFYALCRRRRSVRWYKDEAVPRELVDQAIAAAAQAPSACNRQPFFYRVFDDAEQAREIAGIAMGTKGFVHNLPALVVLVGQLRAYPFERDRHAIYIDASLSAMSFIFAMETMGLATCSINWPDHEPYETRMRERLGLEEDERVVMLIAYGWPDPTGLVPHSTKRDLPRMRSYNQ